MWPARWCFRRLHPDTGNQLHDDRVTAVREEPDLHREFYLQDVTDGMPSLWKPPEKIESAVQLVFGLGFHSSTIEDDDHDALRLASLNEVRRPGSHTPNCSVTDCVTYNERKLSSIGSTQHVCVSRDVSDGRDCQTECAIIVRSILWRLRRECAMWIPTALEHRQIRCGSSDCAFFFYSCTMSVSMHFERSPICQFVS